MITVPSWWEDAENEAVFNIYLYLIRKTVPHSGESLQTIVAALRRAMARKTPRAWSPRDVQRCYILEGAVKRSPFLAKTCIGDFARSKDGLNACTFIKPDGTLSVVFRGTASGEWIDNGEGLSGIPEENTYLSYNPDGTERGRVIRTHDYASDAQVEALNWFQRVTALHRPPHLTVSGHSKGGNKAQFITMQTPRVDTCYSFNGQGFSPEAVTMLQESLGEAFEARRRRLFAVCGENDYVHVLGMPLVPAENTRYVETHSGWHTLAAMLDNKGVFYSQCEQGALPRYVAKVSADLMAKPPRERQFATRGVMNILSRTVGKTSEKNDNRVSVEDTVTGLAVTLHSIYKHNHH